MTELAGQVALVTGGGSGLGRAIVERFLREGARVGVLERSVERAREITDAFGTEKLVVIVGDVRTPADNALAVAETTDRFGRLDIFVGNAGVYDRRVEFASLPLETLDAAFDELFAINVKGYLLGARAALSELRKTRGCMIFTASVSSVAAGFGGTLYIAAKHAIAGLTRQLAYELAPEVRVNAIAPGYVPTALGGLEALGHESRRSSPLSADALPLQEVASAEDYAAFYAMFASAEGRRTATGSILMLDGGLSVVGPAFRGWTPA